MQLTASELISLATAIGGALLGLGAAAFSVQQVFRRRNAERELRRLIVNEYMQHATGDARHIDQLRAVGPFKEAVEQTLDALDEPDQRQIKEALNQPTEAGRRSYIWKLLQQTAEEARKAEQTGSPSE